MSDEPEQQIDGDDENESEAEAASPSTAPEAHAANGSNGSGSAGAVAQVGGVVQLGQGRYVQGIFLLLAAGAYWLANKLITQIWAQFLPDANAGLVAGVSALIGIGTAVYLYRRESTRGFVKDVVAELAKCTWPTRPEMSAATVVVIVTSIVASIYLGLFDFVWAKTTDLVYGTDQPASGLQTQTPQPRPNPSGSSGGAGSAGSGSPTGTPTSPQQ